MSAAPGLHIERLFATPLLIDEPRLDASIIAGEAREGKSGGRGTAELLSHVRRLATAMTHDIKNRPAPNWVLATAAFVVRAGELAALTPRYDAFWRGLYVADNGYGGEPGGGGELVLLDPRLPTPLMELPERRLVTDLLPTLSLYTPEIVLRPGTGKLLMMPGWLRIEQRPFAGRGDRVLIDVACVAPLPAAR